MAEPIEIQYVWDVESGGSSEHCGSTVTPELFAKVMVSLHYHATLTLKSCGMD